MRLLILGGTVFLGRALVEAALARGHAVTLFNRGRSHPELFPGVEKLRGDRAGDLESLRGRTWDAVVDTSGYVPRLVKRSAEALAGSVGRYVFISSVSVYADVSHPGVNEGAPLAVVPDPATEDVTDETYGALKALCEQAAEAALPDRVLVIRPGLIVGPHDPTDRFTYWPVRLAEGGEALAPGRPGRPVQLIDALDLAEWTLRMAEAGGTGVYNATGPARPFGMGEMLEACAEAAATLGRRPARLTWVEDEFLVAQGAGPWMELPLWLPETDPLTHGMLAVDISKALAAGLSFRPMLDTARDTLAWAVSRPQAYTWRAGLAREHERELLATWYARGKP